jgi:glycosyltransferase involved in cell wall biosynthesis
LSGGGAEEQLALVSSSLADLGHEVHVAYQDQDSGGARKIRGVQLHRLIAKSHYSPALVLQLFKLSFRIRPDVLQTWILQADIIGGLTASIRRQPWALREPTSVDAYTGTCKQNVRRWLGKRASAIACNSPGGARYWRSVLPANRIRVIPNALQAEAIERSPAATSEDLGVRSGTPVFLFVGRFVSVKNIPRLVDAGVGVLRRHSLAFGVFCGDGPLKQSAEEAFRAAGLSARVLFTGFTPHVIPIMKRAQCLIAPSLFEGCPNAVMQAAAAGLPMVLSDIEAHRDLLRPEEAIFVDPKSSDAIREGVLLCLASREEALKRADRARSKVKDWSPEVIARAYESFLNEIHIGGSRQQKPPGSRHCFTS